MRSLHDWLNYVEKQQKSLEEKSKPKEESLEIEEPVLQMETVPSSELLPSINLPSEEKEAQTVQVVHEISPESLSVSEEISAEIPIEAEKPEINETPSAIEMKKTPRRKPLTLRRVVPTENVEEPHPQAEEDPLQATLPFMPDPVVKKSRVKRSPSVEPSSQAIFEMWKRLPRHVQLLMTAPLDDEVAQRSYKQTFRESREELIRRLLDPPMTLEDTARVLGVCPTTVRRYTNRGLLPHYRTNGNQRRFRLSDVLLFLESHGKSKGK